MKMTKDNAQSLMNDLISNILREKYPDIPFDVVEDIISISKENRDRAKSLKKMRKYMVDYFKTIEACSE